MILLASVVFVWFATRSEGDVVRKTDLFDGGVWVSNAEQSRFGRLNKPAGQLDAGVAAPGTASSGIDVVQDGAAVVGISKAANQLLPINPKTATLSESSQVTLPAVTPAASATSPNAPAASVVDLRGGTLAVVDPAKGTLWAQRVDTRAGIGTLEQVQPSAKPRAAVGAAAAVAVGSDGTVYAASGTKGSLVTLRLAPGGADFADPVTTPLGFTTAQLQLTAVGGHWVALDGATGKVWSEGQAEPAPLGTVTGRPVLQQPGPDAPTALVQTGDALLAVPLAGGAAGTRTTLTALPNPGAGSTPGGLLPSPPVRLGDCVHAGWAGPDSVWYGRACSGATDQPAVQLGALGKGVRTDGVRLRVNRGLIALNDLDSGNVWDVDD
ncbi:MAG: fibronectin type III domain-containing protein, partial [Lapillicoccus sp.]